MGAVIIRGDLSPWCYGYGYGYGYGDGNGYGNGNGDGNGDGNGYGYGYGYGYGNGNGDGYGDGDGDGDGNGNGNGDGYWLSIAKKHGRAADERLALWWSDKDGLPCNGGSLAVGAAPGVVHESPGPLATCNAGTLHATLNPTKWKGERLWVVAMHGEVVGDEDKYGCLKREIIAEVT